MLMFRRQINIGSHFMPPPAPRQIDVVPFTSLQTPSFFHIAFLSGRKIKALSPEINSLLNI